MRVLCAAMPGPGHAHPMLAVARALAGRGHDVTFSSSAEHDPDAARAGCEVVPLPITAGSPLHALRPYEDSEELARAFAPEVARIRPKVVVADLLTLGAALAAEINDVPYASLIIHPLHTPSRDLPPFGFGARPGRGLARARDAWMRRGNRRDLARARGNLNAVRARLGLPATTRLDGALSPHLQLVATLPSLELPRSDWPAAAHVIGPCLWDPGGERPPLPPGDGPLVLIAASTAWADERLIEAALYATERLGARAIVTTGKSEAPRGVAAYPFASHDALLPHCAAVVCNGGHGVVARALSHGVPLVVLPGHGDQRENGYRVERAGAGLRVLSPRRVPAALSRVLDEPAFAEAAARIRAEAEALDGPARAAELVEGLARRYAREPGRSRP